MSTLSDEDLGLRCVGPPDSGPPGPPSPPGPPGDFHPSAYSGIYPGPILALYPTYAFDAADFSFEFWCRWGMGNATLAADVSTMFVISDCALGAPNSVRGLQDWARYMFGDATYVINDVVLRDQGVPWESGSGAPAQAVTPWWHHHAATFDRDGNLLTYIDGRLVHTLDISAGAGNSLGTCYLIGPGGELIMTYAIANPNYDDNASQFLDWSALNLCRMAWGPWAIHNRILTAAEITSSYHEKRCQNLGSTVTVIYIDPKNVESVTAWDHDASHVLYGIRVSLLGGPPIGIPRAAQGVARLTDTSGNNRHITLPTRATYDDAYGALGGASDVRGWVAFIAEQFWK